MTDSKTPRTDLVKTLRIYANGKMHEAADEIERLESELAEARADAERQRELKREHGIALDEAKRRVSALERLLGCPPNCRTDNYPGCGICMTPTEALPTLPVAGAAEAQRRLADAIREGDGWSQAASDLNADVTVFGQKLEERDAYEAQLRGALQSLEQAYTNKHSPQHRAACLAEARVALAKEPPK